MMQKKLLEQNIDPSQTKQSDKRKAVATSLAITFEGVARELLAKNKTKWSESYAKKTQSRFERHIFPWIGSLRIATANRAGKICIPIDPEPFQANV